MRILRHVTDPLGGLGLPLALAALALIALSLVLPYSLSKDEWSWLVWGREVRHLELHLSGGTVWKPLPVLFTTFLSVAGDIAPHLWLALVRVAWLLALVAGYRVGAQLGGRAAGLLGAASLLLIPQYAQWLAYFGRGSAEPIIVALVLWAIDRHVHGHRLAALALASAAVLGRPEPWPLVIAYGAFLWRGESARGRAVVLALLATAPVLWLGGNWWGAGDPLSEYLRVDLSREGLPSPGPVVAVAAAGDILVGIARFAGAMVIAPVWVAAGFAWLRAVRASGQGGARPRP